MPTRQKDDAPGQQALDTALLEVLQFVAVSDACGEDMLHQVSEDLSVAAGGSIDASGDRHDCKARSFRDLRG